jgi:hypothetical protein
VERKPEAFGTTVRVGSTSLFAGIHLLNGYSPIRPAGVATEFDGRVHGEIGPEMGSWLLEHEAGPDGKLAQVGVDGIIVANEFNWEPRPANEWEPVVSTDEGRVFHRRGGLLARIRSVKSIDSQPEKQFASAQVTQIVNGRNELMADVNVPGEGLPALLTLSRPFFDGYRAKIGATVLRVDSYRGLVPTVEVPPGISGRLTVVYRPWWLVIGGAISVVSLLIVIVSVVLAIRAGAVR